MIFLKIMVSYDNRESPGKIFVCRICRYATPYRWLLRDHLMNQHKLNKRQATKDAAGSEYLSNPMTNLPKGRHGTKRHMLGED
jgi:hypothetical protein